MEYEKCYVYNPSESRPTKRRRVEATGLHATWPLRQDAYRRAWEPLHDKIASTLTALNSETVTGVRRFLDSQSEVRVGDRIPTCFIASGPNKALHTSLLQQILDFKGPEKRDRTSALISSSSAGNLKAVLRCIIRGAVSGEHQPEDDEEEVQTGRNGSRLLNYDLQILANHVNERKLKLVTVSFPDTEAFDTRLLSELIELLGCWHDRIPFVFLFNIATSVDFLQQRLTRSAAKYLHGHLFDVVPPADETEHVFHTLISTNAPLWIGPNLMGLSLERQADYIQNIEGFVDGIQYAYMACYYANALSLLLDHSCAFPQIPGDHFEAARNLPSFQAFCQHLLSNRELTRLRHLLDSDEALFGLIRTEINSGRQALTDMMVTLDVIRATQMCIASTSVTPRSKLYVQALSNKLQTSTLLRSLLLTIRKSPSSTVIAILDSFALLNVPETLRRRFSQLHHDLSALVGQQTDATQPLRSVDDVKNSTLRTTVVAQKVELSKQRSTLSKQDAAYTALVRRFTDLLEDYFKETLIDPASFVFHEIFLYDLKSPHRETLTPRPRHAVERAFASPHDYLDCSCCAPTSTGESDGQEADVTLAASQPATALLYQLYLESGVLINVSDLWLAFRSMMGSDASDEGGDEEKKLLALFQRALAELRHLGLVKATRRRVDHVAKVAWRGL